MAQTCDAGDLTSSVTAAPCHLPQRGRLIWFGQVFSHRKSNFTANTRQSYSAASDHRQSPCFASQNMGFSHAMNLKVEAKGLCQPFHILNRSGQEALLAHVLDAEHASKAQAMVFFGLRKGALNCFFAPCINPRASRRLRKVHDAIQSILPNMSVHHPSLHGFSKAFFSSAACRTGFLSQKYCLYPSRVVVFQFSSFFSGQIYISYSQSNLKRYFP